MSQDFYPTSAQLSRRLLAAGFLSNPPVTPEEFLELDAACAAAADAWESDTGFSPFLADTAATTHYFDGDGSGIVDLQGGFVTVTGVALNGTARTLNTDYRLMPQNAVAGGKPFTYLKWGGYYRPFPASYGYAGPVAVTGKRGAYAVLPDLAVEGIFALAICLLLGTFEYKTFRAIKSWKIGTDERAYDPEAFGRLDAASQRTIKTALRAYRRTKVA